jgi:NAD+ kinase
VNACKVVAVFTHRRPDQTRDALAMLIRMAREAGVELRFGPEEAEKHGLQPGPGVVLDGDLEHPDLCIVLGGDGSILTGLRRYASSGVPVFGVNFGEIGFLATIDPPELEEGIRRAFSGDFEVLDLPAIVVTDGHGRHLAMNDVSVHREPGGRVADLAYSMDGEEIGRVRCDGLVVATPAGSTGYNLANGGPVLAWGVEGFVVSFIAPHSLTARALVAAPSDIVTVRNRSVEERVEVFCDGRKAFPLEPGEEVQGSFTPAQGRLAQLPGTSFYHRLRQRFGRLAN